MKKQISFTKLTGAGNDFILIDNRGEEISLPWDILAKKLCDRNFGIGADGLLIVEHSNDSDFEMKYFNSDGSYGGMCGNGGRCIAHYYFLTKKRKKKTYFRALGETYIALKKSQTISIKMKDVFVMPSTLSLRINSHILPAYFLDVGSPHAIIFYEDFQKFVSKKFSFHSLPVEELGKSVRENKTIFPLGTNVDFVQKKSNNTIKIRVYERGVEAETLACGTGAVASALVTSWKFNMSSTVTIIPKSNQKLYVSYSKKVNTFKNIWLEGNAQMVFQGSIFVEL
ncbi:MAG: diaminopimelate epimerase [Ignavibacteria bacterium]|nr:diaminopimelate epimerase [Ignavibacteria bacterium]